MKTKTSKKNVKTKQAKQKTKIKPLPPQKAPAQKSPKSSSNKKLTTQLIKMRRRVVQLESVKSEHKAIEEALKETEISLRAILSSMEDIVFVLDKKSRFVFFHSASEEDLYLPPHKFMGKKYSDVMPPYINKLVAQAVKKNKKGQSDEYECSLTIKNKEKWFYVKHSPIL